MLYVPYSISLGPQPVGVQCPLTSSLGEFPNVAIGTGSGILGYRPCWCPSPFPLRLPYLGVSPFTLLHLPLDFIRVSALWQTYLHPFDRPFTCWWWVFRLGTGSYTRCCGLRGGAGVRMKQKSRFKFLSWGLNLGPCSLMVANVTTRLRRTQYHRLIHVYFQSIYRAYCRIVQKPYYWPFRSLTQEIRESVFSNKEELFSTRVQEFYTKGQRIELSVGLSYLRLCLPVRLNERNTVDWLIDSSQ